jgi:pantoate--beta-alanine ligase
MNAGMRDALQLQTSIQKILAGQPLARVDYVAIVDVETFEPVSRIDAKPTYVLLAVYVGKTRLIDNSFIERVPGRDTLLCSL